MRDLVLWGTAVAFLLVAFYTVQVRRELYALGGRIGTLESALMERKRLNDNLQLEVERLTSPMRLTKKAQR